MNTDFSQVEADEQQVNLTRFSLFFPEKRDFFLENSGVFQFGSGDQRRRRWRQRRHARTQSQDMILFFSRQIGLSATGDAIPILGGTRLTGRAGGMSVGALNIQQRAQDASPSTNFSALRLRRDILRNSDIGVMALEQGAERQRLQPRARRRCQLPLLRRPDLQLRRRQGLLARRPSSARARRRSTTLHQERASATATTSGNSAAPSRPSATASTTRWASCRDAA